MSVNVALAGATGALGQEILRVLERAPWRPDGVVPLASSASKVPFVEWGEAQVAVDDAANADFAEIDLLIAAVPGAIAPDLVGRAREDDVLVVDCSAAELDEDVPVVLPWVNPQQLMEPPPVVRIPSAPASLIASALGPLARAGATGAADVTVLAPASWWGRDGIDELSRQVTTLFNAGTPPRKVFPTGLAFDLLPMVGAADASGWTDRERAIAAEAVWVAGWEGDLRVTVIGVPVFSGLSAEVRVQPSRRVPTELVEQILVDGGMRKPEGEGARAVPRPRRVEGQPFPQFDRVRVDSGGAVHFWTACDNLRMSAAIAVAAGGVLVRSRQGVGDQ